MKISIILCCMFALASCKSMKTKKSDFPTDFVDLVKGYGYTVESFDVQTEDGYILEIFRIPHNVRKNIQYESGEQDSSSSSSSVQEKKGAVLLMHGVLTNAESFVYGGPSESIALRMVDAGYDVYFGNARGTIYGQRHTTLDPQKDAAFWRFCWHEIGTKDLPAIINKVLSVSKQTQLSFIGHNEGTTAFYVLASELPEMRNKIDRHISLGPVVFLKESTNEILKNIEDHSKQKSWLIKNLGANTFSPSDELIHDAETNCVQNKNEENACKNTFFLMNGYNSGHLNWTTINQFKSRVPSTASVREIWHLGQLKATGRFERFSEDFSGEEYDLSQVNIPVALFYTPRDCLSPVSGVQTLAQKLPNVYFKENFEDLDNNLDLLYSENMMHVADKVIDALEQNIQGQMKRSF